MAARRRARKGRLVSRRLSLALAIAALGLAACEQTVSLDDRAMDGGLKGTGGGTGSGSKDGSADGHCTPISFSTDLPQMVVALDRSSYMDATFGTTDQLHAALSAIQADVSHYAGGHNSRTAIQFSFVDFPDNPSDCNASSGCCPSDVTSNYSDFQTASTCSSSSGPSSCVQSMNRPTAAALNKALEYFTFAGSSQHNNEQYVLLVSDGDPVGPCSVSTDPCSDAEAAVKNLANIGVTTEVVAIGDGSGCLKDLGTVQNVYPAPYTVASGPGDLPTAIDEIAGTVADNACRLTLASPPSSAGHLTVTFDNMVQSLDSGTSGDGWGTGIDSYGNTRVYLHGSLCQSFLQTSPNSTSGLQILDGSSCGSHTGP